MDKHIDKKGERLRRAQRGRAKIRELHIHRLCVHRTPRHIYAQLLAPDGSRVVASASSVEADIKSQDLGSGKLAKATAVGKLIAERSRSSGVTRVAFDRSGFKYHGRIKALADAAREHGLEF